MISVIFKCETYKMTGVGMHIKDSVGALNRAVSVTIIRLMKAVPHGIPFFMPNYFVNSI